MSAPEPRRTTSARVLLYWLPLGAAGRAIVRHSGRLYEAIRASREHRHPRALYHSALQVELDGDIFGIEMGPAWGNKHTNRDVVSRGPVGSPLLGHWRLFQYEVRCWPDGSIPDLSYAVADPEILRSDRTAAQCLLNLIPAFPIHTWGRDELGTGDMWNSNSLISWLLSRSGHKTHHIQPPQGGRAPGWTAGLAAACLPHE